MYNITLINPEGKTETIYETGEKFEFKENGKVLYSAEYQDFQVPIDLQLTAEQLCDIFEIPVPEIKYRKYSRIYSNRKILTPFPLGHSINGMTLIPDRIILRFDQIKPPMKIMDVLLHELAHHLKDHSIDKNYHIDNGKIIETSSPGNFHDDRFDSALLAILNTHSMNRPYTVFREEYFSTQAHLKQNGYRR